MYGAKPLKNIIIDLIEEKLISVTGLLIAETRYKKHPIKKTLSNPKLFNIFLYIQF